MADGPIRDFAGTDDGEWRVVGGDFSVVAGSEAVPQGARLRVGLFAGESYVDGSKGVRYLEDVLVKNADPLVVRAELAAALLETPDVTDVVGAQLLREEGTRDASISFELSTVYTDADGNSVTISGDVEIPGGAG